MLDQEPLSFPSRNRFFYNPGVPDRQLWAIGMVVVQWGMTETLIDQIIRNLIGGEERLIAQYSEASNFRAVIAFFREIIEQRLAEPQRMQALELVKRTQNLASQRHEIIHRLWGGGIQLGSWNNPEEHPTTDAGLLMQAGDKPKKTKSQDARSTMKWQLTFAGIRKVAVELGVLNRDYFIVFFSPPREPLAEGAST